MIEIALLLAWIFTHALYRGAVGTYCTVKKIDPPWVRSRQERLTNQEIRRSRWREATSSPRTARGFVARWWGDLWEDAHAWRNESRADREKRRRGEPISGKPVVSVDANQAADWARNLGGKAKSAWNRWWGPSQRKCPWLSPVLNDAHTHVEGRACGQRVRLRHTYCPSHEDFAAIGHCLRGNGDAAIPPCMSHRHGHFPFCASHLEEWGNKTADQEAAATPAVPEAAQVGTLNTPDTPELAATEMTDEQRQLAAMIKDAWLRGERVEPDPTYAEWFALPVSVRADLLKAAEDGGIWLGTEFDTVARAHAGLPIGGRETDQPAARPATDSTVAGPNLPQPVKRQPGEPLCQWGRDTTSESPDHGEPECGDLAGAGGIHCLPHQIEHGRWEAATAAPQPPEDPSPVPADSPEPPAESDVEAEPAAEPEVPPQRPMLRVVPNTNTQGDTDTMTTPATSEITSVQALASFAARVKAHGDTEWPQMLEAAESQMGQAGLTNDAALTNAIGGMREAAAMFAARGAELEAALVPHQAAAEQVSGLGNRAADMTATYQNQ